MVNSPTVASRQLSIAKSKGVRSSVNRIRKEVEILKHEVDFLLNSVDDLQAEADVLIGLEGDLNEIATTQGKNVDEIIELVNENEVVLDQMKGNLRQTFVAAVATVVIRTDKDGDMKISAKELPLLALRLQILLEPYGINLDTNKFEAMIEEDNDISHVLKFCADVLFQDEEKDDDDDNDSADSELTFDFEAYCKGLGQDEERGDDNHFKMSFEDKISMVTIDKKLSKGSVEVARGKRMTLLPSNSKKDLRKKTIVKEVKRRQSLLAAARRMNEGKIVEIPAPVGGLQRERSRRSSIATFLSGMVVIRGSSGEF